MNGLLPGGEDLLTGGALAVTLACMTGLGRVATRGAVRPEAALIAGWGALCLAMTVWGAFAGHLAIPLLICALASLPGLWKLSVPIGMAVLSLPLLAVLLPALPSQVDTWLNLLPNLAFLADHGALPADGGPPAWSFLPAAPYNTQFTGFAVSLVSGHLAANALSLFNAALLSAAGLLLARACVPGVRTPPLWACAAGLLLAMPLNPGFVPRIFLAGYGEAPIAVTLLFATALAADLFAAARDGHSLRGKVAALALTLAALVEIKQSALGLLLPFGLCLLTLGLVAPGMKRARWASLVARATAPALFLYGLYRWYVLAHFAAGELKMLPVAAWHLKLLPQIFGGIAFAIFEKATYFLVIGAVLAAGWLEWRRRPWQRTAIVLALAAGLIVGFNAFLLFTYVAHFPAIWAVNAHSYFRYMSQLSLVVMLGLTLWLRPVAAAWLAGWTPTWRRRGRAATIGLVVLLPLLGVRLVRFDLAAPQPFLWTIAHEAAGRLHDGDRLALILPGDGDDAVGSLLRGVLLFTPPRRPHLVFRSEPAATPAALEDARSAGFLRALVVCAPRSLSGIPGGQGGMLAYRDGAWRMETVWQVPAELARERFSAMLPKEAFCQGKTAAPS